MGKKLTIKGHPTRGNEVIELFKMMGGWECGYCGCGTGFYYYISQFGNIEASCKPSKFDTYIVYTLEEFLEKFPYKVGDIVKTGKDEEGVIKQMRWVNNDIVYWVNSHKTCDWAQTLSVDVLDKYNRINLNDKVNENDMESCKCPEYEDIKKIAYLSINDKDYADEIEINLGDDYEYKFEMNRLYILKKKPKYPKLRNLTECKEILGEKDMYQGISGYKGELLTIFQRLLIFRDVYWKIAGEELELGKPWKPNFGKYIHYSINFYLYKDSFVLHKGEYHSPDNRILVFPIEDMRDAFYENFKNLIEQCKELL